MTTYRSTLLVLLALLQSVSAASADELGNLVRAAVKKADPSIVRLRVIGGEQSIDGDRVSSLVTTGVVISDSGEIVTSLFALQGNPEAVLVENSSGGRSNAKIIATDHVRRIVLLKAQDGPWKPAAAASPESVEVGQYSVALGRFYSADASNVSVGIVSALKRIHGMAIQTDAKISPTNYGGPLVNLKGEVQGILVPLSPRAQGNAQSGVEWYDSGIGFAIPMSEVMTIAERLRGGKDLKPGRLGMRLKTKGMFSSEVLAEKILKGGPADAAGIQKGDRLVSVNGRPLERVSVLEEAVASRYAGDVISIDIKRGEQSVSASVTLVEELPIPQAGELGFLHVRVKGNVAPENGSDPNIAELLKRIPGMPNGRPAPDAKKSEKNDDKEATGAVPVVVTDGGAGSEAGLPIQIELLKVGEVRTTDPASLLKATADLTSGDTIAIEYRLPDSTEVLKAELNAKPAPEVVPVYSEAVLDAMGLIGGAELKRQAKSKANDEADDAPKSEDKSDQPAVGGLERRELKFDERGRAIVMSSSKPSGVSPGVVLLLSAHSAAEEQIALEWKSLLESHHLMLVIPINPENTALTSEDIPLIATTLNGVASGGRADLRRVVVVADREQAKLALQATFDGPSPIRGIALTSGWFASSDLDGLNGDQQTMLLLESPKDAQAKLLMEKSRASLRKLGFWTPEAGDKPAAETIANWSLRLRVF